MRGGKFNFDKFFAYRALLGLLYKLDIIDEGVVEDGMFEPNPLIRAQNLFIDPFED